MIINLYILFVILMILIFGVVAVAKLMVACALFQMIWLFGDPSSVPSEEDLWPNG